MKTFMIPCSICLTPCAALDLFSKGECLTCHEAAYKADGSLPDFTKTINI